MKCTTSFKVVHMKLHMHARPPHGHARICVHPRCRTVCRTLEYKANHHNLPHNDSWEENTVASQGRGTAVNVRVVGGE